MIVALLVLLGIVLWYVPHLPRGPRAPPRKPAPVSPPGPARRNRTRVRGAPRRLPRKHRRAPPDFGSGKVRVASAPPG